MELPETLYVLLGKHLRLAFYLSVRVCVCGNEIDVSKALIAALIFVHRIRTAAWT